MMIEDVDRMLSATSNALMNSGGEGPAAISRLRNEAIEFLREAITTISSTENDAPVSRVKIECALEAVADRVFGSNRLLDQLPRKRDRPPETPTTPAPGTR